MHSNNGIDFEKRFGKKASAMDEGEWRMAITSIICETMLICKDVPTMKTFYKILVWSLPFLTGGIVTLSIAFIAHLGK